MKIFSEKMITAIIALAILTFVLLACSRFSGGGLSGGKGGTGWKVWVKTNPCAGGRTDWISVAKENPTYGAGGDYWQTADLIMSPQACTRVTDDSCTFAEADASANVIRASSKFHRKLANSTKRRSPMACATLPMKRLRYSPT